MGPRLWWPFSPELRWHECRAHVPFSKCLFCSQWRRGCDWRIDQQLDRSQNHSLQCYYLPKELEVLRPQAGVYIE